MHPGSNPPTFANGFSSIARWKPSYYVSRVDGEKISGRYGSFRIDLIPELLPAVRGKSAEAKFRMELWLEKGSKKEDDPFSTLMMKMADSVSGVIRSDSGFAEWIFTKLNWDKADEGVKDIMLYECSTETSLELIKAKATNYQYHLDIEIDFRLCRPLRDQLPLLVDLLYTSPSPNPYSFYSDPAPLIARPPDLALQVNLTSPDRVEYVYFHQESLAANSAYLEMLVNAADETEELLSATGNLDDEAEMFAVDDDSDTEEDQHRYTEFQRDLQRGLVPARRKRRMSEESASQWSIASSSDLSDFDKEIANEGEDQEMGEALPERPYPNILHTTAPVDGVKMIKVPHCALSTLQAVAIYIITGGISFAPLSLAGKKNRTDFIQNVIDKNRNAPIPVSPRSVYRIAKRFGMEELAGIALADFKKKLTDSSAGYKIAAKLALHRDCLDYPQVRTVVHEFVQKNWNYLHQYFPTMLVGIEKELWADLTSPMKNVLRKSLS